MHSLDRAPMSFLIRDIETRRDEAVSQHKDEQYYAYTEMLELIKRRFPEMFQVNEHRIKTEWGK